MQPLQRLFIRGDRQKIYLHFPNRHKFRHQPKPRLPICEWRPKFQLLPLGRAIHNGATFSMFSNEFSRWKSSAGANTVAQSSSCFTSYNWPAIQERRLFPSQKNWVCPFGKTRFIPSGKTGFNRQQMGINARKALRSSIFAAFLTFLGKFCPKKFVWWEFSPCHLFAITLAFRPFFTLGIPFFYAFKCAATKREGGVEELHRGQWKTL